MTVFFIAFLFKCLALQSPFLSRQPTIYLYNCQSAMCSSDPQIGLSSASSTCEPLYCPACCSEGIRRLAQRAGWCKGHCKRHGRAAGYADPNRQSMFNLAHYQQKVGGVPNVPALRRRRDPTPCSQSCQVAGLLQKACSTRRLY